MEDIVWLSADGQYFSSNDLLDQGVPQEMLDHPLCRLALASSHEVQVMCNRPNTTVIQAIGSVGGKPFNIAVKHTPERSVQKSSKQVEAALRAASVLPADMLLLTEGPSMQAPGLGVCSITQHGGLSLRQLMQTDWYSSLPDEGRELLVQQFVAFALTALKELHSRGYIHRDIKPDNVVIDPQAGVIRLIDFGLMVDIQGRLFFEGCTNAYMPPELAANMHSLEGQQAATTAALDVFLVGLTALELWLGQLPAQIRLNGPLHQCNRADYGSDADYQAAHVQTVLRYLDAVQHYFSNLECDAACFHGMSRAAVHCLMFMLCADPTMRHTADEAQLDPWLSGTAAAIQQQVAALAPQHLQIRQQLLKLPLALAVAQASSSTGKQQQQQEQLVRELQLQLQHKDEQLKVCEAQTAAMQQQLEQQLTAQLQAAAAQFATLQQQQGQAQQLWQQQLQPHKIPAWQSQVQQIERRAVAAERECSNIQLLLLASRRDCQQQAEAATYYLRQYNWMCDQCETVADRFKLARHNWFERAESEELSRQQNSQLVRLVKGLAQTVMQLTQQLQAAGACRQVTQQQQQQLLRVTAAAAATPLPQQQQWQQQPSVNCDAVVASAANGAATAGPDAAEGGAPEAQAVASFNHRLLSITVPEAPETDVYGNSVFDMGNALEQEQVDLQVLQAKVSAVLAAAATALASAAAPAVLTEAAAVATDVARKTQCSSTSSSAVHETGNTDRSIDEAPGRKSDSSCAGGGSRGMCRHDSCATYCASRAGSRESSAHGSSADEGPASECGNDSTVLCSGRIDCMVDIVLMPAAAKAAKARKPSSKTPVVLGVLCCSGASKPAALVQQARHAGSGLLSIAGRLLYGPRRKVQRYLSHSHCSANSCKSSSKGVYAPLMEFPHRRIGDWKLRQHKQWHRRHQLVQEVVPASRAVQTATVCLAACCTF